MLDDTNQTDTAPEAQPEQAQPVSRGLNKRAEHTKPKRTRYVPRYIPANDLGRTVGIEVTFIPGMFEKSDNVCLSTYNDAIKRALYHRIREAMGGEHKARARITKFSTDPDCIEMPTTKHKTRSRLMQTLNILHDQADALGLVGHVDWHGGGGAHIHVGLRENEYRDSAFVQALYRDLTHRPYLTWAFCNVGDNNSGARPEAMGVVVPKKRSRADIEKNIQDRTARIRDYRQDYATAYQSAKKDGLTRYTAKDYPTTYETRRAQCIEENTSYRLRYMKSAAHDLATYKAELAAHTDSKPSPEVVHAESMNNKWCGKYYGVTYRRDYHTLEWRMFRAPNDTAGHERQLNFALAYMEHIERIVTKGKAWGKVPAAHYQADANKLQQDWGICRAVREFKATLRMLGLRVRDYAEDIENLRAYFDLNMPKPVYVLPTASTWTVIPLRPENVPAFVPPVPVTVEAEPVPEVIPTPVVPYQRRGRAYNSQPTVRRSEVQLTAGDTVTLREGHTTTAYVYGDNFDVGVTVDKHGKHRNNTRYDVVVWNGVRVIPDKRTSKPAPVQAQDTGPILRSMVEYKEGDTYVLRDGTEGVVLEDENDHTEDTHYKFGLWGNKHGKLYAIELSSPNTPIVINGRPIIED